MDLLFYCLLLTGAFLAVVSAFTYALVFLAGLLFKLMVYDFLVGVFLMLLGARNLFLPLDFILVLRFLYPVKLHFISMRSFLFTGLKAYPF